ncbi:MAG: PleD family two-component system response regulator [Alphaproteobacteria bacterium]|nr:PleD family two-component system response regulator [Alphaproteobacteria bacterium]
MTARVLVVDDIVANVKLLEAKLRAEYFEVVTAMNGPAALEIIQSEKPDIVLLDVMMPGMDGIEVCRRIKGNPQHNHIPVVMVTALDSPEDRVRGIEAGADDFLTKPVNDVALFCRVRSLLRLKMLTDELRARAETSEAAGLAEQIEAEYVQNPGRILLVDDLDMSVERIRGSLQGIYDVTPVEDPQSALFEAAENPYDLIVVSLDLENFDGLRLCSQIRSLERTRQIPVLVLVEPDQDDKLMRGLDMGVNDYLVRPVDRNELHARVKSQIRRWRYTQKLRQSVQESIELAVTDPLTGLHNRRYLETHLSGLVEKVGNRGKALTILALDIDHFKSINDNHGHDVGDRVLQEFAHRVQAEVRGLDLVSRTGGEEFIVVLPYTNTDQAHLIAERIRESVCRAQFEAGGDCEPLDVTVSIGVSALDDPLDQPDDLLKRADLALYDAKRGGRNRVISNAA